MKREWGLLTHEYDWGASISLGVSCYNSEGVRMRHAVGAANLLKEGATPLQVAAMLRQLADWVEVHKDKLT